MCTHHGGSEGGNELLKATPKGERPCRDVLSRVNSDCVFSLVTRFYSKLLPHKLEGGMLERKRNFEEFWIEIILTTSSFNLIKPDLT